jgi:hypothetical protein
MGARGLTLSWRRVPGGGPLPRMLARARIRWSAPTTVSQPARSARLLTCPAVLFARVLYRVLARLPARHAARPRPLPADLAAIQTRFAHCSALDGTTLEALVRKRKTLRAQPPAPRAGQLGGLVDLGSHLPAKLGWAADPATPDQARAPAMIRFLGPHSLLVVDLGALAFWLCDALPAAQRWFVTRLREQAR